MKYIIIDVMENEIYRYCDEVDMFFSLDFILAKRDRLEIPYKLINYNFGKIVVIRD